MNLELITPEKKVYSGEATSVNMPAIDGMVEILRNHAPLIAALKVGQLKVTTKSGVKRYQLKGGFAEVLNNNIVILAEGADELA